MDDELLKKLAEEYGTPLYAYDGDLIVKRCREFREAFSGFPLETKFCYAVKANSSLAILTLIRKQGFGADVVSAGELDAALKAGFNPRDVVYTSNSKSVGDIKAAIKAGVNITADNTTETELLKNAGGRKIAFRVNPDVEAKTHPKISTALRDSKFGLHFEGDMAFKAAKKARELGLVISGVHCHIGSNISDASVFSEAAEKMMDYAIELKKELDVKLKFIDFGGGLGISYRGEKALSAGEFAGAYRSVVESRIGELGYKPEAWFEPGRFIVAEAGVLLARVNSVKETPAKRFINVNCGFNALVRPAMYDAYHRAHVVGKEGGEGVYDIAGNLCESGDILARQRKLPKVERGDVIAIHDTGAYGFSMASTYNSQPLPAEVLVKDGKIQLIRKMGRIEDLYFNQKIPDEL